MPKIIERLGLALAGNAHPRCIYVFRISAVLHYKVNATRTGGAYFMVIRRRFELRTHCLKGSCSAN